jgi:signal peptidase I
VLIATSFKSAIADWNIVPTGSMKPTILEGDRIFVNHTKL